MASKGQWGLRGDKKYAIFGERGSSYVDFCKNRLIQFESCAILANVQKSKTDVPQKDLSMVGTNLKASLFLQFPIEKKVIKNWSSKKKSLHCLQF